MQFASNWRKTLRHAWSVRLMAAGAILSAIEAALPLADAFDLPTWLHLAIAIATPGVVAAAFIARFVAQKELPDG